MAYLEVDDSDFQVTVDEEFAKGQVVILKFYTEMCDACNALDMELEDVDEENDNVSVIAIDCAISDYTANRFGIMQVPTMIIMRDATTTLLHYEGIMMQDDIEAVFQ